MPRSRAGLASQSACQKRLMRDWKRMQRDSPLGIKAAPIADDIMHWEAVIFGADDTAWKDGTFKLTLEFSRNYPNQAPKVQV